MDLTDTARLLTYIAGVDPRMAASERDAMIRQQAWQHTLADVDAAEAASFARRYYRGNPQWSITPGEIYQGCKPNPRNPDRDLPQLAGRPIPDDVREQINHLLQRDPVDQAARQVPCPWPPCKASVGNKCNLPSGESHPSRKQAGASVAFAGHLAGVRG